MLPCTQIDSALKPRRMLPFRSLVMTIAWDPVLLAATQVSLARFPLPSLSCQKPPGSRVGGEALTFGCVILCWCCGSDCSLGCDDNCHPIDDCYENCVGGMSCCAMHCQLNNHAQPNPEEVSLPRQICSFDLPLLTHALHLCLKMPPPTHTFVSSAISSQLLPDLQARLDMR